MPAPPPPPTAANLPHNWTELIDPKTGHPYYFNTATKESSWTAPRGSPGLPRARRRRRRHRRATAASLPSRPRAPPTASRPWRLRPRRRRRPTGVRRGSGGIGAEWTVATDPASGAMYWWNRDTGARTWEDPTRMSRPATPEPMEMSQVRVSTRTGSPQTPMDEASYSVRVEGSAGRRNGSILAKIDGQLPKRINTYLLRPWLRKPPPASDEGERRPRRRAGRRRRRRSRRGGRRVGGASRWWARSSTACSSCRSSSPSSSKR